MSDFKIIATTAVESVTEVRLYDETLEKVSRGHPEVPIWLPCITTAAETAITAPSRVKQDRPRSVVFVDDQTTNASGDPLHVPCRIVAGTSARVTSIYFASSEKAEAKE